MSDKKMIHRGRYWLPLMPNWKRVSLLLAADAALIFLSLNFSFIVRLGFPVPHDYFEDYYAGFLPWFFAVRLGCFALFGLYYWSFRYASVHELLRVVYAVAAGSLIILALRELGLTKASRAVLLNEALVTTILVGGARFSGRIYHIFSRRALEPSHRAIMAGPYEQVEMLIRSFMRDPSREVYALAVVDSSGRRAGQKLHGVPVIEPRQISQIVERQNANTVILVGNTLGNEARSLIDLCERHSLQFRRVNFSPGLGAESGVPNLSSVRPEDLLAREPVNLDVTMLRHKVAGRRILVTGSAGSIGSELVRQLADLGPARLILVDWHENALYLQERGMERSHPSLEVASEFCDIKVREGLEDIFARHKPDVVFHAAAHKHVPVMERCPREAVLNNVGGFLNVADCSIAHGVERVVYISTDKAVHPSSVMGFSKRLGELLAQAYAGASSTSFVGVRFGNVLGSNGSVIHIFLNQIENGGPVTVTHPDMTRFFMTIREAVQLVIQGGLLGGNGNILVLDMGRPVKLVDFARELISISGRVPDREIPIRFIGLRPGEKMHEELARPDEPLERFAEGLFVIRSVLAPGPAAIDESRALVGRCRGAGPLEAANDLRTTIARIEGLPAPAEDTAKVVPFKTAS